MSIQDTLPIDFSASAHAHRFDTVRHLQEHEVLGVNASIAELYAAVFVSGQFPPESIRLATLGDSTAGFATNTAGNNLYATAAATPGGTNAERIVGYLPFFSNGQIRPVFDGGVGGETTTQIAARAVALTGGTKPLVDAQALGCTCVVITGGINEILAFTTGTAEGTITTAVNLAIANIKTCVNAAKSLGMYAFYSAITPYGETGSMTADLAVVAAAAGRINAGMASWLAGIPDVGEYYDARSLVSGTDGGWNVTQHDLSSPPIHSNHNGAVVMASPLADRIVYRMGNRWYRQGLSKGQNMWNNADLSANAAGLATGITVASGSPTNSIIEWRGVQAQQFLHAAGSAVASSIDITFSVAGASPFVPVAVNDILGAEFDLYVDDNAGGAPEIYNCNAYLRKSVGATATIYDIGYNWPAGSSQVEYTAPIDGKVIAGHILIDEVTGASSGTIFVRLGIVADITTTKPIRVIVSNFRAVKLTATF